MKKITIILINFYQIFLSPMVHTLTGTKNACRFSPTCSEYAKNSISEYGVLRGSYLSLVRILKCQPFYSKAI